jgi:hypothetical protein
MFVAFSLYLDVSLASLLASRVLLSLSLTFPFSTTGLAPSRLYAAIIGHDRDAFFSMLTQTLFMVLLLVSVVCPAAWPCEGSPCSLDCRSEAA